MSDEPAVPVVDQGPRDPRAIVELLAHDLEDMRVNGHTLGTQMVRRAHAVAAVVGAEVEALRAENDEQARALAAWPEHHNETLDSHRREYDVQVGRAHAARRERDAALAREGALGAEINALAHDDILHSALIDRLRHLAGWTAHATPGGEQ